MVVSEVEVDTPKEWLKVLIELEEKVHLMNIAHETNWYVRSGMTKKGLYIQVKIDTK